MAFGPQAQTPEQHRKEVAHRIAHPPQGAFGGALPRNLYPAGGAGLREDGCHRDSDRIDADGMPKVGAAVWPGEAFCNTVRAPAASAPRKNFTTNCSTMNGTGKLSCHPSRHRPQPPFGYDRVSQCTRHVKVPALPIQSPDGDPHACGCLV